MSQSQQIYAYLRQGGSLTALKALTLFGCLRLAARIDELRQAHPIKSQIIKRGGKRIAEYTL